MTTHKKKPLDQIQEIVRGPIVCDNCFTQV